MGGARQYRRIKLSCSLTAFWPVLPCARIAGMEQFENQPIYEDRPKPGLNITLMLALAVAVLGIVGGEILLIVMGLAVAAFNWFTTAKRYRIYQNALVVEYGRPRVKAYPFDGISHLELLELPLGARLRVRMHSGGRFMISTQNIEEFRDRLDEALSRFNDTYQPPQQLLGEEPDNSTPY